MRGSITIECDECIEDITINISNGEGVRLPLKSEIRFNLVKAGWHAGRRCLCPTCYAKINKKQTCQFCSSWHSGGGSSPWCGRDMDLALKDDMCKSFSGI